MPQFDPPIKDDANDFNKPKRDDAAPAPKPRDDAQPPPRRRRDDDRAKPALPADPVERALAQIKSNNRLERLQAIEALGKSGDKRAPKALAEALKEQSLRRPAADALRQFGSGAEEEVALLLNGTDVFTQQAACEVLKDIGTQKSLPALRAFAAEKKGFAGRAAQQAIDAIKARKP
jgi:HEAT repeat protein